MSSVTIRNIIIAVVLIVATSVVFGLIIYQVDKKGDLLSEQIQILKTSQAEDRVFFQLRRVEKESENEREQLSGYFLKHQGDSVEVLNYIENAAPMVGVEVDTSGLDLVKDVATGHDWVTADFSFSGSRERVLRFIQVLENLPYVSKVMNIQMRTDDDMGWQANATVYLRIILQEDE